MIIVVIIAITVVCLIHTLPIDAQCYGCGQNSSALKQALIIQAFCDQHFDHGPTLTVTIGKEQCENPITQVNYKGANLTVTNLINKTTFQIGENITVVPELTNTGNHNVTIGYCGPLFVTLTMDQSGRIVSPQYSWACPLISHGITLKPNVSTTGESYGQIINLHTPGNYTIKSIASFGDESKSVVIWSEPLQITVVPEKYLQNTTNSTMPQSVMLTPFDISFLKNDFNRTGVSHQILVLKPNQTSDIHVMIYNNDNKTHQINLQVPMENLGNFVSSYSFDPSILTVYPYSSNETVLHITAAGINDTQTGLVSVLAQDKSFGMKSKAFYLAIGNNIPDSRLDFIDQNLREAMPGPAFPNLHDLDSKQNQITGNVFGVPTYLPSGYKLQGMTDQSPGPLLVYSPVLVTSNTTGLSFMHSGGITVYYQTNDPSFDLFKWMPAYIGQNEAQQVSVNGITGVAIEQQKRQTDNIQFMSPSRVILFKDTSQIDINGDISLDELLKMASSVPIIKESQTVLPQCVEDNDFPGKPCNDVMDAGNPNQKPILGDKDDWKAFYDMKGKDWMESKKQEMYFADQNGILKEWYEYGSNSRHLANSDVWYYYSLYGESPDIIKYYNGMVQKNWIYPIITYYYVSPIVFVIIGVVAVVGFFMTRKILVKIRK
jgi:hypothetical protein